MNSGEAGSFNRLSYDNCEYQKRLYERTAPLAYQLYQGKYENCDKCVHDKFWVPYDPSIVQIESELKNITRPASKCTQFKYRPNCKSSNLCTSTFSKNIPVVYPPEVCPIIFNNIPRTTDNGQHLPTNTTFGPNGFCK